MADGMEDKEGEPADGRDADDRPTHRKVHPSEPIHTAHKVWDDGYQAGYMAAKSKSNPHRKYEDKDMAEGINSDRVVVNAGGDGGGGMGGMAAVIAALGNRNQGDNTAALIAALGQRNEHRGDDGFGLGGGMGGILGLAVILGLLRNRGGFGGGDGDCGDVERPVFDAAILGKLGSIEGAIPAAGLNVENAICRSTGEISNAINQSQLASLAAFSNLKDAVTNTGTILLGAGAQNTKEILGAICGLGSKIDQNQIADLNRQLAVAQLDGVEHRLRHHTDNVENRVSQNVSVQTNQLQSQWQYQRQEDERFARLVGLVANIGNQVQRARNENETINFGTMAASGIQTPTTTQVR